MTRKPDRDGSTPSSLCGPGGPPRMARKQSARRVRRTPKAALRLPDLDQLFCAATSSAKPWSCGIGFT